MQGQQTNQEAAAGHVPRLDTNTDEPLDGTAENEGASQQPQASSLLPLRSAVCRHPHCQKKAKPSMAGHVQYCMAHMREHGQQPSAPRCQLEGCIKYAQQSIDRQRIYCVVHMREKGIIPAAAVCRQQGCSKEAKVSVDGRRIFCIQHMKEAGLQPRIAPCQHPGCMKQAQPSREGPSTFCKAHMRAHNMHPRVPLCQQEGCTKVAKQSQEGLMLYCIQHMKEHGIAAKATCAQPCCTRFARLSTAGTHQYCEQHMKLYGMTIAVDRPNTMQGAQPRKRAVSSSNAAATTAATPQSTPAAVASPGALPTRPPPSPRPKSPHPLPPPVSRTPPLLAPPLGLVPGTAEPSMPTPSTDRQPSPHQPKRKRAQALSPPNQDFPPPRPPQKSATTKLTQDHHTTQAQQHDLPAYDSDPGLPYRHYRAPNLDASYGPPLMVGPYPLHSPLTHPQQIPLLSHTHAAPPDPGNWPPVHSLQSYLMQQQQQQLLLHDSASSVASQNYSNREQLLQSLLLQQHAPPGYTLPEHATASREQLLHSFLLHQQHTPPSPLPQELPTREQLLQHLLQQHQHQTIMTVPSLQRSTSDDGPPYPLHRHHPLNPDTACISPAVHPTAPSDPSLRHISSPGPALQHPSSDQQQQQQQQHAQRPRRASPAAADSPRHLSQSRARSHHASSKPTKIKTRRDATSVLPLFPPSLPPGQEEDGGTPPVPGFLQPSSYPSQNKADVLAPSLSDWPAGAHGSAPPSAMPPTAAVTYPPINHPGFSPWDPYQHIFQHSHHGSILPPTHFSAAPLPAGVARHAAPPSGGRPWRGDSPSYAPPLPDRIALPSSGTKHDPYENPGPRGVGVGQRPSAQLELNQQVARHRGVEAVDEGGAEASAQRPSPVEDPPVQAGDERPVAKKGRKVLALFGQQIVVESEGEEAGEEAHG